MIVIYVAIIVKDLVFSPNLVFGLLCVVRQSQQCFIRKDCSCNKLAQSKSRILGKGCLTVTNAERFGNLAVKELCPIPEFPSYGIGAFGMAVLLTIIVETLGMKVS